MDAKSYAPFYRYTDKKGNPHVVWFEDVRSLAAKFQLVREMKWKGMGGWQMNFPFPQDESLLWLNFKPQ
ncbi:hypothetical protein CHM34_05495 [Paludifilum halophilum]|uniref:GH18 domain-containing protein n=1 Tax=Paludifilum halophilum TaxID=1642702 RepID=A0A235B7M2_9BACL|nr:hypothetical protein CHM34_05495 [Paludifilum halophilum]